MTFLQKKYNSISKRIKSASYGIFYAKSADFVVPKSLKINGKYKDFKFIDIQSPPFVYEFTQICLNDCYHLKALKRELKKVNNIIDIGANQGLFTIAARQHFPNAKISCYEPNQYLLPILSPNAERLNSKVYYEAVTKEDCKVFLEFGETDMHTQTHLSANGEVTGTSLKKVIERAGGKVDLLKMDCEGAEWDLFEDESIWTDIKGLTMEYHLWAKKGSSFIEVASILKKLNFKILFHDRLSESFGIVSCIKNNDEGVL